MSVSHEAWSLLTRLGEAQILLPAMAAGLLWLWRVPATRPLAVAWLGATALAAALTTATKVAFIGWGLGSAALDFTGISGHAMFSAAVLPVLARIVAGQAATPWPRRAMAAGLVLAALVAVSRVHTGAHSGSEAVLGFLLGAAASLLALRGTLAPRTPTPRWLLAGLAAWMLATPMQMPASTTHDQVVSLSLKLSGRDRPHTRGELHRPAVGGWRIGV